MRLVSDENTLLYYKNIQIEIVAKVKIDVQKEVAFVCEYIYMQVYMHAMELNYDVLQWMCMQSE